MSLWEYPSAHLSGTVENKIHLKRNPFPTILESNVCIVMQMQRVSCDAYLSTWVLKLDVCCEGQYAIEYITQLFWITFWCIGDSFFCQCIIAHWSLLTRALQVTLTPVINGLWCPIVCPPGLHTLLIFPVITHNHYGTTLTLHENCGFRNDAVVFSVPDDHAFFNVRKIVWFTHYSNYCYTNTETPFICLPTN